MMICTTESVKRKFGTKSKWAARMQEVCQCSFRRYIGRYEADGPDGLIDRRLEQTSNRQASARLKAMLG